MTRARLPRRVLARICRTAFGMTSVVVLAVLLLAGGSSPVLASPSKVPLPVREIGAAAATGIANPSLDAYLGVVPVDVDQVGRSALGLAVREVVAGSPAASAGLRAGDVITAIGQSNVRNEETLDLAIAEFRPGQVAMVTVLRAGASLPIVVTLAARRPRDQVFRKSAFRLAVVPLQFADESAVLDAGRLSSSLFGGLRGVGGAASRGASDGGTPSVAEYIRDQSFARLALSGDVLSVVRLPLPRSAYASQPMGGGAGSAFAVAAALLSAREPAAALAGYDGISFAYAAPAETRSGFALWPHRAFVMIGARRVPYYVLASGGLGQRTGREELDEIGVHCHEFGHLLGLTDAYGAGHRTGHGDFCLMALGHRGGGTSGGRSPFSLCAECRATLGWLQPTVLDPRVPMRVRLRPVATGPSASAIIPVSSTSREYLLLEVRTRTGFDAQLPSEGLLVWRCGGRPTPGQAGFGAEVDLVEAHGIDVFDASLLRTAEIAFPTARARDITPDTVPASVSRPRAIGTGTDALAPYITDIEREADGSVVFTLGVRTTVAQHAPRPTDGELPHGQSVVVRDDPVTGERVPFRLSPPALDLPPSPYGDSGSGGPGGASGAQRR